MASSTRTPPIPSLRSATHSCEVRAASFTPTELLWPLSTDRAGHDRGWRIPAHEGSGIVVALGYGAAGVSVGDEVYGLIDGYRDGWAADYVAIEVRSLAPKPTTRRLRRSRRHPAGRAHVVAGAVRPRPSRVRPDGGHPRRRRRGRVDGGAARPLGRRPRHRHRSSRARANVCSTWAPSSSSTSSRTAGRTPIGPVDLVYDIIGGDVLARSAAIVKPGGALVSIMGPPPDRSKRHPHGGLRSGRRTVPSSARSLASSTTGRCAPTSAPSTRWPTRARRSWPSPPSTFRARSC